MPSSATARTVPPAPGSLGAAVRSPVATLRWLWPAYMTPGRPGRPTTQQELRWIYTAWLGAFLLKMLGSSWDVSWHFKWLRDDLAPPHLLNSAGTAVVIALVVFHSYSGYGVDRRALRLMQVGIATFLVAIPIDILNHRINGLDITSWSPSHALLYLGTAIMLAGAIRGWWLYAAPGRVRDLVSLGLWLFFVENVVFPNQHQEYGVLSLRAYEAGDTTAEQQLLDFAASQGQTPTMFMLPVPSWVHPAWLICAGLLALVAARKVVGLRFTATTVVGVYLAYRAVMWLALVGMGFPRVGAAAGDAGRRGVHRPGGHLRPARLERRTGHRARRLRGGPAAGRRRPAAAVGLVLVVDRARGGLLHGAVVGAGPRRAQRGGSPAWRRPVEPGAAARRRPAPGGRRVAALSTGPARHMT